MNAVFDLFGVVDSVLVSLMLYVSIKLNFSYRV